MTSGKHDRGEDLSPICVCDSVQPAVKEALRSICHLVSDGELTAMPDDRRSTISCLVTNAMRGVTDTDFDLLPGLKTIISCGAGREKYDMQDLAARGIELRDTAEVVTSDTAEFGVTLVLALARGIVGGDAFVRSGQWSRQRPRPTRRLTGSAVGVVGLGRIGSLVAERLASIGCLVSYTARSARSSVPWKYHADIVDLARAVEFLVLCCPGGDETRHMVNGQVLEALGPNGFLVNIARGSVVDEEALISALEEGRVAGAALDVFENEPTPDQRFLTLPNVLLTPHIAAVTDRYTADLAVCVSRLVNETQTRN